MSAIRFDPATARDLLDALRLLEGRLLATGRRLSAGALELREVAEGSCGEAPTVPDAESVPHLLTVDEVSARLHVGRTKVKEEIKAGALPVVHIGRLARIHSDDLADYLARRRASTDHP